MSADTLVSEIIPAYFCIHLGYKIIGIQLGRCFQPNNGRIFMCVNAQLLKNVEILKFRAGITKKTVFIK